MCVRRDHQEVKEKEAKCLPENIAWEEADSKDLEGSYWKWWTGSIWSQDGKVNLWLIYG